MAEKSIHKDSHQQILKPLREHAGPDCLNTLVSACIHFPLAREELSLAAPEFKHWIDSEAAIYTN